jgi:pimeloyl-ACP methyl ester carboxylesterase
MLMAVLVGAVPLAAAGWEATSAPTVAARQATLPSGVRLHYHEQGPAGGPVVLLLHGFTDSSHSFSRVMPLLPATLRVIAPDQRGHGRSDRPAAGYAVDDFARDALQLMDALNVKSATVVGHSMGSFVARRLAELAPSRVKSLALVGSGPHAGNAVGVVVARGVDVDVGAVAAAWRAGGEGGGGCAEREAAAANGEGQCAAPGPRTCEWLANAQLGGRRSTPRARAA